MRRTFKLLALPLSAVAIIVGVEMATDDSAVAPAFAAELPAPAYGPANYGAAVAAADAQMSLARQRSSADPDAWLNQAGLAHALMEEAGLEGNFAALVEAQAVMAKALQLAPENAGPAIVAAHTAMGAHRLDAVEAALDLFDRAAVAGSPGERAEALALRGDIAFYRGDMRAARRIYAEAAQLFPLPGVTYRQALLAKASGEFDRAEALFQRALREAEAPPPRDVANVALQLGGIDQARGRYAEARDHFIAADRIFPGHWLFEAHVAQADYLTGRTEAAITRVEAMLAEGGQPVEIAELYALVLQAEGRADESAAASASATALWDERLAQLPEAAYGHAIEHHFKFGSEARALELAQRNLALRPYGEARLLMAEAQLATGDPARALAQIRAARQAGWLSAPHLRAEVNALEALGRTREAAVLRDEAEAINPHVFAPVSELVWLSHG